MRRKMILHPAFERARAALLRALNTDMPGQLIFVIGLSGAGKSEIRYAVMPEFAGDPRKWRNGEIPVIAVRATPSDRSNFSPKGFTSRLRLAVAEPDLGWLQKRDLVADANSAHMRADERLLDPFWRNVRANHTEHELRASFERMAIARGLRAIFIDEAASMTYT